MENTVRLYEDSKIRTAWNEAEEKWYFSIVDVIGILTDAADYQSARNYWKVTKKRLADEGNELVTNCNQLKMKSPKDGKSYATDVADTEQLLRIIQSIPSKKAEPFKMWLARVGSERIDETIDPELAIDRALETYRKKGYAEDWIQQRLLTIRTRKELTNEWKHRGIAQGKDYAVLTDEISKAWSGMTTREYKNFKGLKKENLRDNMSTLELALNLLAEAATTEISKETKPKGREANKRAARRGGEAAKAAKDSVERATGKSVITDKNAAQLNLLAELIENTAQIEE